MSTFNPGSMLMWPEWLTWHCDLSYPRQRSPVYVTCIRPKQDTCSFQSRVALALMHHCNFFFVTSTYAWCLDVLFYGSPRKFSLLLFTQFVPPHFSSVLVLVLMNDKLSFSTSRGVLTKYSAFFISTPSKFDFLVVFQVYLFMTKLVISQCPWIGMPNGLGGLQC